MCAMSSLVRALSVVVGVLLLGDPALAEVVNLIVQNRQPLPNQPQAYEELTGTFRGELDPRDPQNAIITDIDLAPRNPRGRVEYLRPLSPS